MTEKSLPDPLEKAWEKVRQSANVHFLQRRITIDPITRLEGHGKIEIFLNESGNVERAYFQIPELRGFEKFVEGRPAEEMPQITSRICGVCPTAHHMASTKALDDLYQVDPPSVAKKIRELFYSTFMVEDHALHFYFLGGPDFVVGPTAPAAERNVLGVIAKVGIETGQKVIAMRRKLREILAAVGGKAVHPVLGLPGGVAKRITPEMQAQIQAVAKEAVDFAQFTLEVFHDVVLKNTDYVNLILSDVFTHRTYYMGLVDQNNHVNFYDGWIRVVSPEGKELAKFRAQQYLDYIAEHVEPWSYVKFCYLKPIGWKGFTDGLDSGVYCVAPLARLNASEGMATPLAQEAYREFYVTLGGKPVHHTLANHWARVIELLYAAERMKELADDPELIDPQVRTLPTATPREGIGVVEAPRGTLIHHYQTDERGVIQKANLIVATQNNAARIAMSVEKAAKGLISGGSIPEGILNMVEMAFRAYDPCHACATHSLPGSMPLLIRVRDPKGKTVATLRRDFDGSVYREP
ncbi:MAG: Ni/Fe hydrogenase subunit alpha [Armatimonadota bacterium]|nr:Ni/Fe hydrogenase subunit alpha [Armatimonadota bacterium]MDR5702343.1 Ni/Fe hydrogenase subunit alpha [Armatimonadota bacterium]